MTAPTKRYFNPNNPHTFLLHNGHPVIPLPALQGLLRALLSHWKCPANEKEKMEQFLLPTVLTLSHPKHIQICEKDESPYYEVSVAGAAAYVDWLLEGSNRNPSWQLFTSCRRGRIRTNEGGYLEGIIAFPQDAARLEGRAISAH